MSDVTLNFAVDLLNQNQATCVILSDEKNEPIVSYQRGVKPLLALLENGSNVQGSVAADKVVGKAAAMLYALLGIIEIYACVISEPALEVLSANGIKVSYGEKVPMIRNRTNTGFCPMEQATMSIDDPNMALEAIKLTLKRLESSTK